MEQLEERTEKLLRAYNGIFDTKYERWEEVPERGMIILFYLM